MAHPIRVAAALFGLFAVGLIASPAEAQDYSRNCKSAKGYLYIPEGRYEGTFSGGLNAELTQEGITITSAIKMQGHFTVTIDRKTPPGGVLSGESTGTIKLNGMGMGIGLNAPLSQTSTLSLKSVWDEQFAATGKDTRSGTAAARGQGINVNVPLMKGGQSVYTFIAKHADCEGADGTLRVDTLEEAANELSKEGAKVSTELFSWKMTSTEGASEKIDKLTAEMLQTRSAGSREAEGKRLGQIADRDDVKKSECLTTAWRNFVTDESTKWIEEDIKTLRGFKGDEAGLNDLITTALGADRGLVMTGLDVCSTPTHERLFIAIENALAALLDRMLSEQTPAADILRVLKQKALLGTVAVGMDDKVIKAIQARAVAAAETAYQKLVAALATAKAAKGDPKQHPSVLAAAKVALAAEKECGLLGAEVQHSAAALMGR
ncbi:MAG: hypothetical protein WCQ64_04695 [Acidobacteriota bacterium]